MPEIVMPEIRRILFIELLGGIGDLVIALPAIHAVARSYPLAEMTVLTFAPGNELLLSDPLISQVICAPKGEARLAVDQLLSSACFDLIISDTNYDGIADAINDYYAQQKNSIVITNLWRSPPSDELVSQRFLKILLAEGIISPNVIPISEPEVSEPEIHLTATEKIAARRALGAVYRPLVFLCLDASMVIKRWSAANFITVGKALQHQHGATIVVPVGESLAEAEHLVEAIGGTAQIWQRGSLRQLAAVMAEADLVIAVDTGLAHIAAALQIPTIALFGPSWSGRYGHPVPHINLQGFPECPERIISNFTQQSCWYSNDCPFEWNNCLAEISPEMVLDAANKILQFQQSTIKQTLIYINDFIPNLVLDGAWQSVQNLLVMRLDNIGDVIMTSPALKALKKNLPQAKLTLMASPAGGLTASLLPWVDEVLPWRVLWQDLGKLEFDPDREWQLIETLKNHQFDAAIIFTSFSQSPHPAGLICLLAGIPLRLGESKEQDNIALTHTIPAAPDEIHQVERNLRLIEAVGFHVADRRLALNIPDFVQTAALKKLLEYQSSNYITHLIYTNTQDYPAYILLNPWTSCQSRNYPTDRFAIAARELSKITGFPIVVTGVEKDRSQAQPLLEILGKQAIDLIGRTSLPELVALVAKAQLVLTNNTSVMHIADATETPIVVMFAGTELECQWRPRYTHSRLLRRSTVCNPCYAFACPYNLQCLDIPPETLVEAALSLLKVGITR